MKSKVLIILICLLLNLAALAQENKSIAESKSSGKVRGAIFDATGEAVIPARKVVIQGQGVKKSVIENDNGEYEFDLTAGIYDVTIEERPHYETLYPLKRAKLEIRPNMTSIVNLYPELLGKVISLTAYPSGVRDEVTITTKPPKYESVSLGSTSPIQLVIQFDQKRNRKVFTEYKNVTLTYDNITILAAKILYDKSNLRIQVEGIGKTILIDNNGQKERVDKLSIEIRNGLLHIQ